MRRRARAEFKSAMIYPREHRDISSADKLFDRLTSIPIDVIL